MRAHITLSACDKCENLEASYSAICVHCNACGRFDPATQQESLRKLYNGRLAELREKLADVDYRRNNILEDIEYWSTKLSDLD